MSKKVLQCEYCRHLITEKDVKCPNCGANCSSIIKKYKEEQIAEEKAQEEKMNAERTAQQEQAKKNVKAVALGFGITSLVPIILFIVTVIFIVVIVAANSFRFNHNSGSSKETVTGTIEDSIEELDGYTISIDKYEFYEYSHKTFTDCNTKKDYQRIAFYLTVENTSDKAMDTYFLSRDIVMKANNEVVSSSSLRASDHFCDVVSGKEEYTKLGGSKLLAHDKVSGYVGFEVPKNAEKIKFIINDDKVIEIDNPAYEK